VIGPGGKASKILRYDNLIGVPHLTSVDINLLSLTDDFGKTNGLNPGGQGDTNFSIATDPSNVYTVFVGGDRQDIPSKAGNSQFDARIFRIDTSVSPPPSHR